MKRLTRVALASAAAALVIPASGCASMLSPEQTHEYHYNAGDGASAESGEVKVRGLMLVGDDSGKAQMFFTVVNNSVDTPAEVEIAVGDVDESNTVDPKGTWVQDPDNENSDSSEPLIVNGLEGKPGNLEDVAVTVDGEELTVPTQIVSGDLPYYQTLVPTEGGSSAESTEGTEGTGGATSGTEEGASDAEGTGTGTEEGTEGAEAGTGVEEGTDTAAH